MLPILISVSVAPGSYFFCALAALATAIASRPARPQLFGVAQDDGGASLSSLNVLERAGPWAHAVFLGSLLSRRIECARSMHDWGAVASGAFGRKFRGAEERAADFAAPAARTVKCCAGEARRVATLRTKGRYTINPAQKALWYIESHLRRSADARRYRRRGRGLPLSSGAGVRSGDRVPGDALRPGPASLARRRARSPSRRARHSRRWRWMRITDPTSIHPRVSRPFRRHAGNGPRRDVSDQAQTSGADHHGSRPHSIICDRRVSRSARPFSSPGSASATITPMGARRRHSRPVARFHQPSRAFPARSVTLPMVSAATATMPAISTTSQVSRCPISPTCRAIRAGPDPGAEIRGVYPRRPHLDHPPHRQHDLESLAAGLRHEGRRRAELRALRRAVRPSAAMAGWRYGCRSRRSGRCGGCAGGETCGRPFRWTPDRYERPVAMSDPGRHPLYSMACRGAPARLRRPCRVC